MSNETVDVALCERLFAGDPLNWSWVEKDWAVGQLRALLAERTQLHAVIAELVRLKRLDDRGSPILSFKGTKGIGLKRCFDLAWQRAFDVADGEAK